MNDIAELIFKQLRLSATDCIKNQATWVPLRLFPVIKLFKHTEKITTYLNFIIPEKQLVLGKQLEQLSFWDDLLYYH